MFKKFFSKALVVLAIIITLTTLFSVSTLAVEENTVMTVYTKWYYEEIYKDFDNFEDGWVYALEQSLEKSTTIILYEDWIAPTVISTAKMKMVTNMVQKTDIFTLTMTIFLQLILTDTKLTET